MPHLCKWHSEDEHDTPLGVVRNITAAALDLPADAAGASIPVQDFLSHATLKAWTSREWMLGDWPARLSKKPSHSNVPEPSLASLRGSEQPQPAIKVKAGLKISELPTDLYSSIAGPSHQHMDKESPDFHFPKSSAYGQRIFRNFS